MCTLSGNWSLSETTKTPWTNYSACRMIIDGEIEDESKQFKVRNKKRRNIVAFNQTMLELVSLILLSEITWKQQ